MSPNSNATHFRQLVWPSRSAGSERFLKSYKYKHKHRHRHRHKDWRERRLARSKGSNLDCDSERQQETRERFSFDQAKQSEQSKRTRHRTRAASGYWPLLNLFVCVLLTSKLPDPVGAFCPVKCHCNDLELSANCTQISSISIVPMTLNPLLKQLTLNHLPISELSNSLSIYHQLEVLNLNSLQLTRIRYQNFNFKPAPHVISVSQSQQPHNELSLSELGELQARHLRLSIERSNLLESSEGEIRHHLRELHLANNRLDQLGDFYAYSEQQQQSVLADSPPAHHHPTKLRAHELEKLAPFLSLSKVELLDLSGNQLSRLHQHAFLGLIKLKSLDLARNQLEFIDRYAFVGLLALERLKLDANKLAHHQHQLNHFSQILCRGPLLELSELDLSENSQRRQSIANFNSDPAAANQAHHLVLPNELAICASKLRRLKLRGLNLRHVQVNAFDNLNQLEQLDLSENLFEQVPLDSLIYSRSNVSSSLRELILSATQIEFIAANTFSQLKQLERLEMNKMNQLVSFDLASLITSHQQQPQAKFVNRKLRELRLSHNKRLQAVHSSSSARINFEQLQLIDLAHSNELRELQLDRLIQLERQSDFNERLQLDLSSSNSLNCSSCQMGWLVRAVKQARQQQQQQPPPVDSSALTSLSVPVELPAERGAFGSQAIPATSQLGWSPIPFDPFNSLAQVQFPAPPRPLHKDQGETLTKSLHLLNMESINCAWPFSMSLIELINLETNYAPLFDRNCQRDSSFENTSQNQTFPVVSSKSKAASSNAAPAAGGATPKQSLNSPPPPTNTLLRPDFEKPVWAGAALLLGLVLTGLAKLIQLLVYKRQTLVKPKFSPSFTATTSLEENLPSANSSSTASSSSSSGHRPKPTSFHFHVQQHQLITSTLPDGQCISSTQQNNWPDGRMLPIEPAARGDKSDGHWSRQFVAPLPGLGGSSKMRDLRARVQKSFSSTTSTGHKTESDRRQAELSRPIRWTAATGETFHHNRRPERTATTAPSYNNQNHHLQQQQQPPLAVGNIVRVFQNQPNAPRSFNGASTMQLNVANELAGAQIKEFAAPWPSKSAAGSGRLKQSNLFSRFVDRLSGRPSLGPQNSDRFGSGNIGDEQRGNRMAHWPPPVGALYGNCQQMGAGVDYSLLAIVASNNSNNNNNGLVAAASQAPGRRTQHGGDLQQQAQLAGAIYSNQSDTLNHYSVCGDVDEQQQQQAEQVVEDQQARRLNSSTANRRQTGARRQRRRSRRLSGQIEWAKLAAGTRAQGDDETADCVVAGERPAAAATMLNECDRPSTPPVDSIYAHG